ncbi:X-ray repair cross-complementing protein 5 Ku80 [Lycorma delicatula]|uniref:X-ray repair cross-complementing protein 5 Ku80 n=1 Tax=Lycorma delicatula TaxID=130591 RepID=UPI003F515948
MSDKPEAIAIILHCGSVIESKSKLHNESDFFSKAKNCIIKILLRKMFSSSNDVLSVIFAGSEKTENDLADNGMNFQNIEVLTPFIKSNWSLLNAVADIQPSGITVNWLDAIVVGLQCLRDKIKDLKQCSRYKKVDYKKKLVLLSSFVDDVTDEQVDVVVDGLKDEDIDFVVIGPDILKNDTESDCKTTLFDYEKCLTKSQQLVLKIFNEVMDKATLCSCDDALKELKYFTSVKKRRMAWNVDMFIGPDLMIPITGYKMFVDQQQPVSWKLCSSKNHYVKMDQSFFVGEELIEGNDVVSGFLFGDKIVPFSADEEAALKYCSGERGLFILFFADSDQIPKHLFIGDTPTYIIGNNKSKNAQKTVAAFAESLHEMGKVGIARKVYSKDSSPHIGALFPKMDAQPPALIFVELPFKQEIRNLWFPSLSGVPISDEQLNAVDKLIDDMDLTSIEDDDFSDPQKLLDPYEQYLLHNIAARGLSSDTDSQMSSEPNVLEIPEYIKELINPLPEIVEKSKNAIDAVKELFPLEIVKLKSKKTENVINEEIEEQDASTAADDSEENKDIKDFFISTVSEVGTVNPVSDFKTLLAKGRPLPKVCEQLQKVVLELLDRADNSEMLKKPLLCLIILRSSCLEKQHPELYNVWMKKLKEDIIDLRLKDFWDMLVDERLGLITKEEISTSEISSEEANEFLRYDIKMKIELVKDEEMDIDDLLD